MQLEPKRGREGASEIIRGRDGDVQERRRRKAFDGAAKRLGVNESLLDHERFAYRWISAVDARIFQKTVQDDWEIMTNDGGALKPDATDMGDAVSIIGGSGANGSGLRQYLCRKPRRFYEEDQKEKQDRLDEQLKMLRTGRSAQGEVQGDYVPRGGITIA